MEKKPDLTGQQPNSSNPSEINSNEGAAELAILQPKSDVYSDAQPAIDPETVERFCQVWAEVGRKILSRRNTQYD